MAFHWLSKSAGCGNWDERAQRGKKVTSWQVKLSCRFVVMNLVLKSEFLRQMQVLQLYGYGASDIDIFDFTRLGRADAPYTSTNFFTDLKL